MKFSAFFTELLILAASTTASILQTTGHASHQTSSRVIHQFANGTSLENIAVRSNGKLLVTRMGHADIYEIDPENPSSVRLIHHFAGYISVLGITEVSPDVFSVNVGNVSFVSGAVPKSFSIWTVAFNQETTAVAKVIDIPEAVFPNGAATLDAKAGTVLIADSTLGVVWRVNIYTREYEVVLDDPSFKPLPTAPLPIGINGIRRLDDYLYYTNTFKLSFGRVRIDHSGRACGPFEVVATGILADDFAITHQAAYLSGHFDNIVTEVYLNAQTRVVAGNLNSTLVAGASSAQFGRTQRDKRILYVVTDGAVLAPVNGTYTEGGKVVAVEV